MFTKEELCHMQIALLDRKGQAQKMLKSLEGLQPHEPTAETLKTAYQWAITTADSALQKIFQMDADLH